jgi:S-adenosylhomocysteine hydrolase
MMEVGIYKVKDIADLAEWGRKEIKLAEVEMPGLMAIACRIWRNAVNR